MQNVIVGVINHSVKNIEKFLKRNKISYSIYNEKASDSHLIFSSITQLCKAFKHGYISNTPIVISSPNELIRLSLFENILFADAKISREGVVNLLEDFKDLFIKSLSIPWVKNPKEDVIINYNKKNKVIQYGNKSKVNKIIGNILSTLPDFTHKPLLISFSRAISSNTFQEFNEFIRENRIVNKQNKESFYELDDLLCSLQCDIEVLAGGENKDIENLLTKYKGENKIKKVNNLKRLYSYIQDFSSLNLNKYLDSENNINL